MSDGIQLISDGDGLAVIGDSSTIERFLTSEGLSSKDLGLDRLNGSIGTAAAAIRVGSEISANSGRWVKLTKESAQLIDKYGLMTSSKTGLSMGVVQAKGGQIKGIVQFVSAPGSLLTNPAVLSSAAGIMSQVALQQAMDEITDYLATIDGKVDDVLRAQKDAVLADMIGVDIVIAEGMTIREQRGRVPEVTWSKVQATALTVARTQGYALRQVDALAEKMERESDLGELARESSEAASKVEEWLAVLARCFQLQDAIAVLELDRVLDAAASELDEHRLALRAARQNRLHLIARSTENLLGRVNAVAAKANKRVLLHPGKARSAVNSANRVASALMRFHGWLGIESEHESLQAKRWLEAAAEARDNVLETGADGVDAAKRLGNETLDRARTATGRLALGIAERALRPRGEREERPEEG
ncbi:hypothetical protein [Naasia sp. SYSU D00948]|uniref:hypothetical protein n=1 Tax=Naasia sp. SYSU D00948 TaxID=2817379 RepID=UPI001B317771|nr:hypothetical protein [Naasia sp. SYSU D00948]